MKKKIRRLSDEDLKEYPIVDLVDDWFFRVDEISYGVYRVEGIDRWGRVISKVGIENEVEKLLNDCADLARKVKKTIAKQRQ